MFVLQYWVGELTFMQQSVLITAIRGPDGLDKNHISKVLLRWYRRCILIRAFEKDVADSPYKEGGGSFTGPSFTNMDDVVTLYIKRLDEVPHHFQLHFLHGAEVLGYKHPNDGIRHWWLNVYKQLVKDMHLNIETKEEMERRLGDNEQSWRDAETVTAD